MGLKAIKTTFSPKLILFGIILWISCCIPLIIAIGEPLLRLKGILFTFMLTFISIYDVKTHTIPNMFLLPVIATGLINFKSSIAIPGFFIVSVVFYAISKLTQDGIGGGDIKFIAAAGFVLGDKAIIFAGLISCILFVFTTRLFMKEKDDYHAMAPSISLGCYFAYIIFHQGV